MKKVYTNMIISGVLFLAFVILTVLVMQYDVGAIGPEHSCVGFSTLNQTVYEKIGVNLLWYKITDWLGIIAILVAASFGILGLVQWIRSRHFLKVDRDILALGIYYFFVVVLYVFFESYSVNYRPILLHGNLEASFPSSHMMIVISILGTAIIQIKMRIKNAPVRKTLILGAVGIIIITTAGRLISGVHWFTDIVAGLLLGTALVMFYSAVVEWIVRSRN